MPAQYLDKELEQRGGDTLEARKAIIAEARTLKWPGDWSGALSEYHQRLKLEWAAEWLYSWRVYQKHVKNTAKGLWSQQCTCSICYFWRIRITDRGPVPVKPSAEEKPISAEPKEGQGISEDEFLKRLQLMLDSGCEAEMILGAIRATMEERKRGRAREQEQKLDKEFRINVPD